MAGFPGILTRLGLGPIFKNRSKIRNPETSFSAEQMNLLLWQVAGMNGLTPRAMFICTVSGTIVTPIFKWLSWDPNGLLAMSEITFGYTSTGSYTWSFSSSSYPDQNNDPVPLAFQFANAKAGAAARTMIGTVNGDGKSGTALGYDVAGGAAANVSKFALFLF